MSFRSIQRAALFALLLPCLYFGTAGATFLYRIHYGRSARAHVRLPILSAPTAGQRIVVFAPHCDDEMLGCGGFLQQAVRKRASVAVVMLTNGDAFRVAVERQFRSLHVGHQDYIRFAGIRQEESRRALQTLGVSPQRVLFLGYPDRGLMALWNDNWSPDRPYTSAYTGLARSDYAVGYHPGAAYCGESLLADITRVLRDQKPTDVFVTHPSDDHPDHSAASAFVELALHNLSSQGVPWAQSCRLHYYLIHRGDWPVPQGSQKSDSLVPPAEMASLDTVWGSRPLSEAETDHKEAGILSYTSQTAVMRRFLISFARRNELFGDIEPGRIPRVPDGAVHLDGKMDDWRGVPPAVRDSVNDNLIRDFQAGGDVKEVYACRDSQSLYVRIDTARAASKRVEFKLRIRCFGDRGTSGAGGLYTATVLSNGPVSPSVVRALVSGTHVEMAIPLEAIAHASELALNVETAFAGIQVDRTGYRFLEVGE